ncbi:hypothetical protein BX616_007776 [Lobosporangium transversale]|uniref:Uncharacterized protein n=1 Tax=Lobosporangium transversale TaxID=64571 RepID=A0A1Y2GE60_9FUNG|nr:hypothetical protein BCR41DRAFT_424434 [Lobosporangium transversale]KAF9914684.1 hypothetical protein BX616_007776 [Lobosporangium transversale]ORZ08460.1 hypothetical protein BCR41DRAFT_424434 [Lobosporangium transversale]|eukprot:XP_021878388.1 hypothetical protein BCR41DRAFT_424434 [Lobosporangium transversale]
MESREESNTQQHEPAIPAPPSVQERRMQLEAFQAERALNKSMRASVRGNNSRTGFHSLQSLNRSIFRPTKSVSSNYSKSILSAGIDQSKKENVIRNENTSNDQEEEAGVQEFNTRRIVQHFDTLSKASQPTNNLLGVRRHLGTSTHRVEKKLSSTSTHALSKTLRTANQNNLNEKTLDVTNNVGSYDLNKAAQETLETSGTSIDKPNIEVDLSGRSVFLDTTSTRQDRPSAVLTPTKRKEALYLSQARLLQWHMMNKQAAMHFQKQEESATAQFELVGRSLLKKKERLLELQNRFEVEKELVDLESTLGYQRDQLLAVTANLKSFKDRYEIFSAAFDNESNVFYIPGIDDSNLKEWLGQILECRAVLNNFNERSKDERELIHGISQVMTQLCDIVKQEIQELMECIALMSKVREAESLESSLVASSSVS